MDYVEKKIKVSPKDFFLYLGAMVALYVSAVSLITLLFGYVDALFPDKLELFRGLYSSSIRTSIASLLIIFPIYLFLTHLLNQDIRRNPEKKDLWIRKWLIYLTLFVAGVTIIIDLVVLVNTFLGGELTVRFILKVLAVLAVIGSGFGYYFYDLTGKWEENAGASKMIGWIAAIVVLVSVVSGFFIIGSPQTQRLLKSDQQRVNHLQTVQSQVVRYWQDKEKLPDKLKDLEDSISGFVVPVDPESKDPYPYEVISDLTFTLCADFNLQSQEQGSKVPRPVPIYPGEYFEGDNWQHGVGEVCFERTIDPDRFPPRKERL